MRIATILLAAGASERYGKDKLCLPFKGSTVIEHCISLFKSTTDAVYLMTNDKSSYDTVTIRDIKGSRNNTIRAGLSAIPDEFDKVLIHDAARPFITEDMIINIVNISMTLNYVQYAMRITDGLIRNTKNTIETIERNDHFLISTPFIMDLDLARYTYNYIIDNNSHIYDPLEFVSTHDIPFKLIFGPLDKLRKITYPEDYNP